MRRRENNANFSRLLRKIKSKPLERELGFGKNIALDNRLMNPDGSFNVIRESLSPFDNIYFHLISMSWPGFLWLIFCFFLILNVFFSLLYLSIGVEHFNGVTPGTWSQNFMQAFFFSSQTLTTVGYGHISPSGLTTSILASVESFCGLLAFAFMTGLSYGRFSRPAARIKFSEHMLITPYQSGNGLMFRMANTSRSELIETEVQLLMAINQREENGQLSRKFYPLNLEISKISFFSLSWTVVHALNDQSPIQQFTEQDMADANMEIMVLVKGTDEASQQLVHARRSYVSSDIVWNARFSPIVDHASGGVPRLVTRKIDQHDLL